MTNWSKFDIPQQTLIKMSAKERKELGLQLPSESYAKNSIKNEAELQETVGKWLRAHGYLRRSKTDIGLTRPIRGWQIHIHKAQQNPILLDLLLLANDGRWCEFELKTPTGKWSSVEQETLCTYHGHPVFTDFNSVRDYVLEWEQS